MRIISNSSLWVEKYRPKCFNDLILSNKLENFFKNIIETGDIPNLLFFGTAGLGKTTTAKVISLELGCENLYINGSVETSIDTIRYRVQNFVITSSLTASKKLVILDEMDRMSIQAQEALKVLQEESEKNARFIFCTNNLQRIIEPLHSRCQLISFNYTKNENKEIAAKYFKRIKFILENENIEYDKETIIEIIKYFFPDLRKIINEIQKYSKIQNRIDKRIFETFKNTDFSEIFEALKNKDFEKIKSLVINLDDSLFYSNFYNEISKRVDSNNLPEIILILQDYMYKYYFSLDKRINILAFLVELMRLIIKWK